MSKEPMHAISLESSVSINDVDFIAHKDRAAPSTCIETPQSLDHLQVKQPQIHKIQYEHDLETSVRHTEENQFKLYNTSIVD